MHIFCFSWLILIQMFLDPILLPSGPWWRYTGEQSLTQQREVSWMQLHHSSWRATGSSTAQPRFLPRASYHQVKEFHKPPLTTWNWALCPTFQTTNVFLDMITILKHGAVWESHLDNLWQDNKLRAAWWLCAVRTGSPFQGTAALPGFVPWTGTCEHFSSTMTSACLAEVRCPGSSLPSTALVWIWCSNAEKRAHAVSSISTGPV